MVRLKGSGDWSTAIRIVFQFQYGTIKSSIGHAGQPLRFGFQFQYGTIKREKRLSSIQNLKNFNSSMVRLKGKQGYHLITVIPVFQFQYGTIKSQRRI